MAGPLVDWRRAAGVVRRLALAIGVAVVAGWLAWGATAGTLTLRGLAAWVGAGVAALLVAASLTISWSALQAMLRAGDAGERLAGGDVGLLPPQLRRRRPPT